MLENIPVERLDEFYERLTFPYRTYRQSAIEDMSRQPHFFTVGSSTAGVRARAEWNTLGREIHDVVQVEQHARIVSDILLQLELTDFLVQHTVPEALWFRGNTQGNSSRFTSILTYLDGRGVVQDFSRWQGAFLVRDEIADFLRHFVDYPFLFRYHDLEVLSTQAPLVMIINHHLCIEHTSPSKVLIEDLRARIRAEGILEFPGRGGL